MENEPVKLPFKSNATDHLANERTFLAWIRTSIGIMGFGFVVVKFSLFVRQIALVLPQKTTVPTTGYSSIIGILLVALGAIITIFAFIQYRENKKMLEKGTYYQSTILLQSITIAMFLLSMFLIYYLSLSI